MKRECGTCTLCCRLLPVPEFGKPADARCKHQFSKGCRIYAKRPHSCALWNCRWLAGDDTGQRPDRAHYVVDMMPDFVTMVPHDGSPSTNLPVLQIWVEPGFEDDVIRNEALLAYIEFMGATQGLAALLRTEGNQSGMFVCPPSVNPERAWYIDKSGQHGREHTFTEIAAAMPHGTAISVVVPKDRR